jgi:hypothetical protein
VNFFASYFRNRKQSTHTQHAQSTTQTITHGIPQGSTLSTTFFLLYINDIYRRPTNPKHNPEKDEIIQQNLQNTLDNILTIHPKTHITIQGDLNINLFPLRPLQPFTNLLLNNNLHTTITTPTRYDTTHNSATLIDPLLTANTNRVTAGTISPPISDHLTTLTIFHKQESRKTNSKIKTLSTYRYNKHKTTILNDIKTAITETQQTHPHTTTPQYFQHMQHAIQTTI